MKTQFSTYDAFAFSLKKCADNFLFIFLATIIAFGCVLVPLFVLFLLANSTPLAIFYQYMPDVLINLKNVFVGNDVNFSLGITALLVLIPTCLVAAGVFLGYKAMLLDLYDRGESRYSVLFSVFRRAPEFLLGGFLLAASMIGVLCALAFLLQFTVGFFTELPALFTLLFGYCFIFVCYYVFLRVGFFPLFMIDLKMGPIDSMKMSLKITADQVLPLISFALVSMAAFAAFNGFGIFFVPLAWVYVYRQLMVDKL